MATVAKNENENLEKNYRCFFCNFFTCKKTDYERHIKTTKHFNVGSKTINVNMNCKLRVLNGNEVSIENLKCEYINKIFICDHLCSGS